MATKNVFISNLALLDLENVLSRSPETHLLARSEVILALALLVPKHFLSIKFPIFERVGRRFNLQFHAENRCLGPSQRKQNFDRQKLSRIKGNLAKVVSGADKLSVAVFPFSLSRTSLVPRCL
jgi:hypothetical protein